jgi:biopolymer transport protein TolR
MGANLNPGSGGRRSNRRYRKGRFTEINVTPFVDVMLVLLIVFMVTAPMLTAGVTVDLPDSEAAALPGQDEPLTLSIQQDGSLFIQETKVSAETLLPKLKAIVGEKLDTRIFVRADSRLDYGEVMGVVGRVSSAGFRKVALVTETGPNGSAR